MADGEFLTACKRCGGTLKRTGKLRSEWREALGIEPSEIYLEKYACDGECGHTNWRELGDDEARQRRAELINPSDDEPRHLSRSARPLPTFDQRRPTSGRLSQRVAP